MVSQAEQQALRAPQSIGVSSPAFAANKPIPREHTSFGDDSSPELHITGIPDGANGLAIIVDDPDAPGGTFTHWTVWNLRPDTREIPEGFDPTAVGAIVGKNDFGFSKYMGPKPPSGTHRYRFRVFALDKPIGAPINAAPAEVWRALAGNVRAWGELVGTFTKP